MKITGFKSDYVEFNRMIYPVFTSDSFLSLLQSYRLYLNNASGGIVITSRSNKANALIGGQIQGPDARLSAYWLQLTSP
jgi:hypothetical protein